MNIQQSRQKERAMIAAKIPHNIPRQFNILCPDLQAACTCYGRHNRLQVSVSWVMRRITVREDHGTGPRMATMAEIERMIRSEWPKEAKGMKFIGSDSSEATRPATGCTSTWHEFRIA